jgi:hypothetical protein
MCIRLQTQVGASNYGPQKQNKKVNKKWPRIVKTLLSRVSKKPRRRNVATIEFWPKPKEVRRGGVVEWHHQSGAMYGREIESRRGIGG